MPFGPLDTWDDTTLDTLCASDETAILEKKGSEKFDAKKQDTTQEIAKQVSAFANSGGGFLVFGINKTGQLDQGVPEMIGREPIKAWVEALVPRLVEPPVIGLRARFLARPGHHQPGFGVLAIEILRSEDRPHWVRGNPDVAYLRAGEHSVPMPNQTLLDVASRQGSATGDVFDLHVRGFTHTRQLPFGWTCQVSPLVGLVSSGAICREWGVELYIEPGTGLLNCFSVRNCVDAGWDFLY